MEMMGIGHCVHFRRSRRPGGPTEGPPPAPSGTGGALVGAASDRSGNAARTSATTHFLHDLHERALLLESTSVLRRIVVITHQIPQQPRRPIFHPFVVESTRGGIFSSWRIS